MLSKFSDQVKLKMKETVKNFRKVLKTFSTGRASPSILDSIYIEYYGKNVLLKNLSSIIAEDSNTLRINTFDSSINKLVKKSIMSSNLGLNPSFFGKSIRVIIPSLTEERRKQLVKSVNLEAEKSRIQIRNIRREANEKIKGLKNKKMINNDVDRFNQEEVQKLTNTFIGEIDQLLREKKTKIMYL